MRVVVCTPLHLADVRRHVTQGVCVRLLYGCHRVCTSRSSNRYLLQLFASYRRGLVSDTHLSPAPSCGEGGACPTRRPNGVRRRAALPLCRPASCDGPMLAVPLLVKCPPASSRTLQRFASWGRFQLDRRFFSAAFIAPSHVPFTAKQQALAPRGARFLRHVASTCTLKPCASRTTSFSPLCFSYSPTPPLPSCL